MNWSKQSVEADGDGKRRDYFKQQQQLRTMAKRNALSADDMIENLLSKKEIFRKKTEPDMKSNKRVQGGGGSGVGVLFGGKVPQLYEEVWNYVKSDGGLADTGRVSPLLMTSGLSAQTLAYIWALANCTVAGSLTQHELYTTLALIALAQNGYSFNSAAVVQQLNEAPVPRLETRLLAGGTYPVMSAGLVGGVRSVPTVADTLGVLGAAALSPLGLACVPPHPSATVAAAAAAATTTTLSTLSASDLGPALLDLPSPAADQIFGDFQSSLSSVDAPPTNTLSDEEFDDFKSADLIASFEPLPPPMPPPSAAVQPLPPPPQLPRPEDPLPAILPPHPADREVVHNANTLPSPGDLLDLCDAVMDGDSNRSLQEGSKPSVMGEPVVANKELSVTEDKYSALRMLVEVDKQEEDKNISTSTDEFGDFVTAPEPTAFQQASTVRSLLSDHQSNTPSIQVKCMEACVKVLQTALSTLQSIVDPELLTEITTHPQGINYLQDLVEVFRICERLMSHSRDEVGCSETTSLHNDLKRVLPSLTPYLTNVLQLHMEEEDGPMCGVCLCRVGPVHVKYGINNFHAPCANFYLHCVDQHLPIAPVTAGAVSMMSEVLKQQ